MIINENCLPIWLSFDLECVEGTTEPAFCHRLIVTVLCVLILEVNFVSGCFGSLTQSKNCATVCGRFEHTRCPAALKSGHAEIRQKAAASPCVVESPPSVSNHSS